MTHDIKEPADLSQLTVVELTSAYNSAATALGKPTIIKFKDKPTALARLSAIREELAALQPEPKPTRKRKIGGKLKNFNYDVAAKVKPPKRDGTKFSKFVDAMLDGGALKSTLIAMTMEFTGETVETTIAMASANRAAKKLNPAADGYSTDTWYRTWKDLNNLAKRHGYGMRWTGIESDPICLFERKEEQDAWDAQYYSIRNTDDAS